MSRTLALVLLVASLQTTETLTCWTATEMDGSDRPQTVTVCLVEGSVVEYGEADLDVELSPAVGEQDDGYCWYWTSRESPWVLLGIDETGGALLGYDPGGGSWIAIDEAYPSCGGAPAERPPPVAEAWRILSRYEYPEPEVNFDPPLGRGIVGMEVFAGVTVPEAWSDSLISPETGRTIEVETWVDAVRIDWGDGSESLVPRVALHLLTGYPDGAAPHAYRTKTCDPPGGDRCHPSLGAYPIIVEYRWWARYRVDGGDWVRLSIEPTSSEIDYPVDEIVGVLTDVG